MENIVQINDLIKKLSKYNNDLDLEFFKDLESNNKLLKEENAKLKTENSNLQNMIKKQSEEHSDFKKVSFVQTLNKELSEKNNYISILESQMEKLKKKEPVVFNPDAFEDINGYELITYKKQYYLRDMESNEIYSIENNKPLKVVGLLSNGKCKLH